MREIRMGETIVRLRKARGVTQRELAGAMGVSKASVSKWETGGSFPDLVLLPRLASYFRISIDELMGYTPQMDEREIRLTFQRLSDRFSEGNVNEVMAECRELAGDYSACFPLLLRLVLFYVNCLTEVEQERQGEVLEEALGLCRRIRKECEDEAVRKQATGLEGACLLLLGRPEQVLELMGDGTAVLPRDEGAISLAYQRMGEGKKAGKVLQVSIYQHLMAVVDDLISYLYLNGDNRPVFEETWGRLQDLSEVFHLKTLKPSAVLQAYMTGAIMFSRNGEEEKAMELLEEYLTLYDTCGQAEGLGGDRFFDEVERWLLESVMNSGLMRSQRAVQKDAVNGMLEEPDFDSLRKLPRFQEIRRQLKDRTMGAGKGQEE